MGGHDSQYLLLVEVLHGDTSSTVFVALPDGSTKRIALTSA
jgi:hypothetical protein